jgi:anti-sigma B factor antagonist
VTWTGCSIALDCVTWSRWSTGRLHVRRPYPTQPTGRWEHPVPLDVRSGSVTGPLGNLPPSDELMTVIRRDHGSHPVLVVHGEVDLSTGGRLRDAVSHVLQHADAGPVILDLSAVDFLSSSGLGHLVALDEEGRQLARPLRIVVSQTRSVVRPITTMGLDDVLSLFDTVEQAVTG